MRKYLLILCSLFAIATATAQEKKISLPQREITLPELFGQIKRQTGTTVIFDEDSIMQDRTVILAGNDGSVSELLAQALPASEYTWQSAGSYILVRPAAPKPVQQTPQPSRAEFEREIKEYTQRNIEEPAPEQTVIRYDTVRTVKPHSGVFTYPARQTTVTRTDRSARTPFTRATPPLLAVKTNLAWWAANGTLNIAGEIGLGKRITLELSGGNNRWNFKGSAENNRKLTHMVIKPELRYWLCERFSTGHFFGVHGIYARYNVGGYDIPLLFEREFRYEGDAFGGGVSYGYNLAFSKRWGMEFTAGVGVLRLNYTKFDCEKCGAEDGGYSKTYFGPTNLGVKLTFMIK